MQSVTISTNNINDAKYDDSTPKTKTTLTATVTLTGATTQTAVWTGAKGDTTTCNNYKISKQSSNGYSTKSTGAWSRGR